MIRIPLYPLQTEICGFLKAMEGVPKADYTAMWNAIWDLTGTPQNPVEWQNPDEWIEQRLTGRDRDTARKLWEGSNKVVNPRHSHGAYWVVKHYGLTADGVVFLSSPKGQQFLEHEESGASREIDQEEGLVFILHLIQLNGPSERGDLLEEWSAYCLEHSNLSKESVFKDYLRRRMNNTPLRSWFATCRKRNGDSVNIRSLVSRKSPRLGSLSRINTGRGRCPRAERGASC